jgi:type I restriction enzyme S subunit
MWTHGSIGDALTLIQNGVNCKQDKSGVGEKITRIETIADSSINYEKTGFAELDEKQKSKAKLEVGDILFSHINSPIHVGKTAIYDGKEPLFHGINLLRLRTIDAVDSRYFNMFLVSLFQSGYWKRTAKQSVNQASVNQTDIKSVPFSYPPPAEQQRIVAKLDAAFAEIDRAVELINARKSEAANLKSSLLGTSLTGDAMMCRTVRLGDVIEEAETVNPASKFPNKLFKYIDVSSVCKERLAIQETQTLLGKDAPSRARRRVQENDVIFATVRPTLKRIAVVPRDLDGQVCSTGYIVLRGKKGVLLPRYLFHWMSSQFVMNYVESVQTGASYPAVTDRQIKELDIQIPPLEEQQRIVAKLDAAFAEIDTIFVSTSSLADNYSALKSAMLTQELQKPKSEAA